MIFKKKTGEFKGVRYEENKYLTDTLISKNLNECLINQTPEWVKKPQTLIRNCDQFTLIHEKSKQIFLWFASIYLLIDNYESRKFKN